MCWHWSVLRHQPAIGQIFQALLSLVSRRLPHAGSVALRKQKQKWQRADAFCFYYIFCCFLFLSIIVAVKKQMIVQLQSKATQTRCERWKVASVETIKTKGDGSRQMLRRTNRSRRKTACLSDQHPKISFRRSWSSDPCTRATYMQASSSAHYGTQISYRREIRVGDHLCATSCICGCFLNTTYS